MKTNRLAELKAKHARELREAEFENSILVQIPDTVTIPTISNIRETPDEDGWNAWLSFSCPAYDPNSTWNPVQQLADLENAGWKVIPATLIKKDNYRPSPGMGLQESFGEKIGRYKVTWAEPIAPLWVTPQFYTKCDVNFFMRSPDGKAFKCSMDVPGLVTLAAQREGPGRHGEGSKYFIPGTARLIHGPGMSVIPSLEIEKSARSQAIVEHTGESLSGSMYFTLQSHEQDEYPHRLSTILAALIANR